MKRGDSINHDGKTYTVDTISSDRRTYLTIHAAPSDYYLNCPGKPQDGDLFISHPRNVVVLVEGDRYRWLHTKLYCPLYEGGYQHSLDRRGGEDTRTLIVRDGLPYTQAYEVPF